MTGHERLQMSAAKDRPTCFGGTLDPVSTQLEETSDLANQEPDFGQFEPFVDEHVISSFIDLSPRRVLEMARAGEIPAHPIGSGVRKTWRFRISEIDAHFSQLKKPVRATMTPAVPQAKKRSKLMARGSVIQKQRANGMTWIYRYQTTRPIDGKRVEHTKVVGLVKDVGKTQATAWRGRRTSGSGHRNSTAQASKPHSATWPSTSAT